MTLTDPTVDNDGDGREEEEGERNDNEKVNQDSNETGRHDSVVVPISSSIQTGQK